MEMKKVGAILKINVSYTISIFFQNVDSEEYWEKLAQESDPRKQQEELLNYSTVIPQLKAKVLAFKAQVTWYNFRMCINESFFRTILHVVPFFSS